jgi:predicted dehydrogenase
VKRTKELRVGVIGAGRRGFLARNAHRPDRGVRLVAGADIDRKVLAEFSATFGPDCFVTRDYRKLLARPDIHAVFVTTPDFLHEEHALAAIRAGKHVYLEKPMAITVDGCDRILRAARRHHVRLHLGHNMRHMTFVRKMKELIDNGAIGEVRTAWCRHFVAYGGDAYFKDWHADRSRSTGLLLQKAAHDIDVMHWLCGGYSKLVNAMGNLTVYNRITDRRRRGEPADVSWSMENWPPSALKKANPVINVEDLSMMQMTLDNGVICAYQQCHYSPDAWRNYTVIGTRGRIENFGDSPGKCVIRLWNRRTDYNPYGDEQFFIPPAPGGHGGADPLIVDEFIRHIRNGEKTTTSPVAARYSVAAGCAATHSLRHGGVPVKVAALPRDLLAYYARSVKTNAV